MSNLLRYGLFAWIALLAFAFSAFLAVVVLTKSGCIHGAVSFSPVRGIVTVYANCQSKGT